VRVFLEALTDPAVRANVDAAVLAELEDEGNKFLRMKTDMLGPNTKAMVQTLQQLLLVAGSSKEKKLIVQLLLVISSCSRLDEYIECVRAAEKAAPPAGAAELPGRHGYDGQFEYKKTDSPRLRDSVTKRASFLSVSLGQDQMEAYIELMSDHSGELSPGSEESNEERTLCRICENFIAHSIYPSHVKFCQTKVGHDIEVLAVDQEISKLIGTLKPGSPLRLLMEHVRAVRDGGFYECMQA
jgi:hypothetical protein